MIKSLTIILLSVSTLSAENKPRKIEPRDWPMYNYDLRGSRFNASENQLTVKNVSRLIEKWRFPAQGSKQNIGPVHATPVVVNGYVYFGTTLQATFYKLTPEGNVKWSYRNRDRKGKLITPTKGLLGLPSPAAIAGSALVTEDTVYFGDIGGYIFALDRFTGKEIWKINTRGKEFKGYHHENAIFSSPILADGKVIVAGGAFEHSAAQIKGYKCCHGRGFVLALEPKTGKVIWKYDVGPTPVKFDPPITIKDDWGTHTFYAGPSTSSVWSTPSYDPRSKRIFFGTDIHNSPRKPTKEDPKLHTRHSSAVIALDVRTGKEQWLYQVNSHDVWNYNLRAYDPIRKKYKDQSIGDTPKLFNINGRKCVGVGCKNGGFYVLDASSGKLIGQTPVYRGPPTYPLTPKPHRRMIALPGVIGGIQTGCATDGQAVYTNGIDIIRRATGKKDSLFAPPTGGRVVSISLNAKKENWRHERPKVPGVGGTKEKPRFKNVGDPVGSGLALTNGLVVFTTTVSNKLVILDKNTGKLLREISLGPVWSGPSISRGRVYTGTGNILFAPVPQEGYFPKKFNGAVISFGLPGKDEVDRMGAGNE